jgi:nucleotide-binding universal stress UspA family protein
MYTKILLPLDGSELAEKSLPYARALADKFGCELIVARVLSPLPVVSDFGAAAYEAALVAEEEMAEQYVLNMKQSLQKAGYQVQGLTVQDLNVAEAILNLAAQEKVDLIVMSTHGRSGLSRWLHGSVATKVLQQAPCPVFLVNARVETANKTSAEIQMVDEGGFFL